MHRLAFAALLLTAVGCSSLPASLQEAVASVPSGRAFLLDTQEEEGVASPTTLRDGQAYDVTVEGTFSYWKAADWRSGACGEPEDGPDFANGADGPVGIDAASVFAAPRATDLCRKGIPTSTSSWRYRRTASGPWEDPPSQTYRPDHRYSYRVIGAGAPLTVKVDDDAHRDNVGALRFTIREVAP